MKHFRVWLVSGLVVIVVAGGFWALWNLDLRWRPHTIRTGQAQIARILEGSGWVSPHLPGAKLYMVSYRSCPDCIRFEEEVFPKLHAVGVDTRVIVIARPDLNGAVKSTPAERATVAEIWVNRSWQLLEQWLAVTPPDAWTATGIPPADGDVARSAVIEAGRSKIEELRPLLSKNGIHFAYPTLIWWTATGIMRGCACEKPQSYRFVEKELGA